MLTSLSYLDDYCERAGDPSLFAEPLNALTNLAFLIAAIMAWRLWRKGGGAFQRSQTGVMLLIAFLAVIGIGSFLWHSYATQKTMLADIIPIGLFMHVYLVTYLRVLARLGWRSVLMWWLSFLAVSIASSYLLPPDVLNGSILYLPAYATLILLSADAFHRRLPIRRHFVTAMVLFTVSIAFRTLDLTLCSDIPTGTHFLWHCLNAVVLYLLVRAVIKMRPAF